MRHDIIDRADVIADDVIARDIANVVDDVACNVAQRTLLEF
jgi:hypothetical protein